MCSRVCVYACAYKDACTLILDRDQILENMKRLRLNELLIHVFENLIFTERERERERERGTARYLEFSKARYLELALCL